jgi:hypothetical protein
MYTVLVYGDGRDVAIMIPNMQQDAGMNKYQ